MSTPDLPKIERVDLRDGWPNEARDFTPWLAEHITELGEALGLDLELQQTEAAVGGYSLDILATDVNGSRPVIIENQLETTNHDHLGKLLTYAAGFDASVIVWLTREFRDEHRQALDWLNQRTDEQTQFFGVVVELWKIDGSRPAPHFSLVATPNYWSKAQVGGLRSGTQTSEQAETNRLFRGEIDDKLLKRGITPSQTKNPTVPYRPLGHAVTRVRYTANWRGGSPGIEMVMYKPGPEGKEWNQWLFQQLEAHREDIESEFAELTHNEQIIWEPTKTRIAISREGDVYNDATESRDEYSEWVVDKFLRFREVFTPRVQELADQYGVEDGEG